VVVDITGPGAGLCGRVAGLLPQVLLRGQKGYLTFQSNRSLFDMLHIFYHITRPERLERASFYISLLEPALITIVQTV